ncbi:MAG: Hsp20/alpha crystallin family protein [Alphaproteobacteria bacterium]|nr:Hsp20/alpha crystallin family protein [Alphaproteobacteria bacterium]
MRSLLPQVWGRSTPRTAADWDPFASLHRELDRLLDDFARPVTGARAGGTFSPRINVAETETSFEVEAELPGLDEKDIDVSLSDNVLTIRGETKSEQEDKRKDYHVVERSYGSFARSLALPFPADPDAVKAEFAKGVLRVTVGKPKSVRERSRKIEIASR